MPRKPNAVQALLRHALLCSSSVFALTVGVAASGNAEAIPPLGQTDALALRAVPCVTGCLVFGQNLVVAANSTSSKSGPSHSSVPARRSSQRSSEPGTTVMAGREAMPEDVRLANASGCGLIGQPGRISLIG